LSQLNFKPLIPRTARPQSTLRCPYYCCYPHYYCCYPHYYCCYPDYYCCYSQYYCCYPHFCCCYPHYYCCWSLGLLDLNTHCASCAEVAATSALLHLDMAHHMPRPRPLPPAPPTTHSSPSVAHPAVVTAAAAWRFLATHLVQRSTLYIREISRIHRGLYRLRLHSPQSLQKRQPAPEPTASTHGAPAGSGADATMEEGAAAAGTPGLCYDKVVNCGHTIFIYFFYWLPKSRNIMIIPIQSIIIGTCS
jgi:hypothetical protein